MKLAVFAGVVVLVVATTGAWVASGPTPVTPTSGSSASSSAAVAVEPPFYATPERAALAAAQTRFGSEERLAAEVVYRFPPPHEDEVRVRVTGEGVCSVWGATLVARNEGWFAGGNGNDDVC